MRKTRTSIVLVLLALAACDRPAPPGGGGSEYRDVPGTATIRELNVAERRMTYDFQPSDGAAKATTGEVYNLPSDAAECVQRNGLAVGKSIPCVRKDRVRGTTSPVVWEFPGLK
jgi:hypothetical protein